MKKARLIALSALISGALFLTGCQNQPTKEEQAGLIGAIAGGLLGSQVGDGNGKKAAIIAGTILGHHLGSSVGRTMDEVDRMKANQALETQPINKTTSWVNPDSGNKYSVTPTKTFFDPKEMNPCREYTTEAWIGGQKEMVYGTACRQDDGSWKIISTK